MTDIEVARPLADVTDLAGYVAVQALVRVHGVPVGRVRVPVRGDRCPASAIRAAILDELGREVLIEFMRRWVASTASDEMPGVDRLVHESPARAAADPDAGPRVTVAVCTRDRSSELPLCLDAVVGLDYPDLDLVLVDNAPSDDTTERLVRERYPGIRYVREDRPGLDNARNRAFAEARGEIVAYTDDDVVLDPGWARALADVFRENVEVMAVTGLVVPYELETPSQILFEDCGGFGRGYARKWFRLHPSSRTASEMFGGAGVFGTGANMAFRRTLFDEIGGFDPALDVGTPTNGGGDLEMFFRVLKEGHTLVYEPRAIARHRHRADYAKLREQIANNGVGLYSYFKRSVMAYPEERRGFFRLGLWWFWRQSIRRAILSWFRPYPIPRDLILAELRGSLKGLKRYQLARREAGKSGRPQRPPRRDRARLDASIAIRSVDLGRPLVPIDDVAGSGTVRVFASWKGRLLGQVDIHHLGQPIGTERLRDALLAELGERLLAGDLDAPTESGLDARVADLRRCLTPPGESCEAAYRERLPDDVSVSVVVATLDRPDDLRNCLTHLTRMDVPRRVEIVVVDNHPESGLTPPVVNEFPDVRLVRESRRGLSYARNAGFTAATGDILVATDDDVTVPPGWLEKLVAPFARNDVMIVTGNVLPKRLETESQQAFEEYGGLGRGFNVREYDRAWFDEFWWNPVPTWTLGATANAAFRAKMFLDERVGLLPEELGPGTPSGVGEDTFLFYRCLKRGHTLAYAPSAWVWHDHRVQPGSLRNQLYCYSKGHVAYHLLTMFRDGDRRAVKQIAVNLPMYHAKRIVRRLLRRSSYPISLILLEIRGNLAGPWCLWRAHRRMLRLRRSAPYVAVADREQTPRDQAPAGAGR